MTVEANPNFCRKFLYFLLIIKVQIAELPASAASALTCGSIETAAQPLTILFLFIINVTGALPPYPYELFEKSSTKNFCSPSAQS